MDSLRRELLYDSEEKADTHSQANTRALWPCPWSKFYSKVFLLTGNLPKRNWLGVSPANRAFSRKKGGSNSLGLTLLPTNFWYGIPQYGGSTIPYKLLVWYTVWQQEHRDMIGTWWGAGGWKVGGDGITGREVQKLAWAILFRANLVTKEIGPRLGLLTKCTSLANHYKSAQQALFLKKLIKWKGATEKLAHKIVNFFGLLTTGCRGVKLASLVAI